MAKSTVLRIEFAGLIPHWKLAVEQTGGRKAGCGCCSLSTMVLTEGWSAGNLAVVTAVCSEHFEALRYYLYAGNVWNHQGGRAYLALRVFGSNGSRRMRLASSRGEAVARNI